MNVLSAAPAMADVSFGAAGILALLGYSVVFLGLILLMVVITIMGKAFVASANRKKEETPAVVEAAPEATAKVEAPLAPGSAGGLKLHDVEPKTAAMIMAIVADKMGKPLNELRFISIKEVK